MFTVTSKIQYDKLKHERNLLQFEQMVITNKLNTATSIVQNMKADAGNDKDKLKMIEESDDYKEIHALETTLQANSDSIEIQLEELDTEIKNFEEGMKSGIQQQTNFWCFSR